MPVQFERVPLNDLRLSQSAIRNPQSQIECKPSILLDGDHAWPAREQLLGEAPRPRPDLDHDVVGRGLERVDDALQHVPVGEEVLAEPLVRDHTLRMTTVRSSAGGSSSRRSTSVGVSADSAWMPEAAITSAMMSAAPKPWLVTSPIITPMRSARRLSRL